VLIGILGLDIKGKVIMEG